LTEDAPVSLFQIAVLAIVQGVTEFLPISSSAHLILVPALTGWPDQGLALDVAVHIGSLLAVVIYFRRDVMAMATGTVDAIRGQRSPRARLALQVLAATIPVILAGWLLKDRIETDWRSPVLIMVTTVIFGLLLWVADSRAGRAHRTTAELTWSDVLLIGAAQALALVPGVSRSGITMTAALLLGQKRPEAARFSLLLSIPTTAAAGALGAPDLLASSDPSLLGGALVAGILACVSALAAIAGLMAWLRQATFTPFVIYRLLLGSLLGALLVAGVLPNG
jgi:undecaprenyl-diphosphatase